ncbi:MAG: hypothetical protein LBF67_02140 [Prevotellaceae bacterium]|jgi:hypothetical protein|nr:hypothetical protein [Prevotellaceae bacterium]
MAKPSNKYDRQHLLNLGLTERQVTAIFDAAVKEAAAIGTSVYDFSPEKPFSFADYPNTRARIDKVVKDLKKRVEATVVNGVRSEWTLANNKNNALCDLVFGGNKDKLTKEQERKYYSNNSKALEAFLGRKTAGLSLSDRVWRYADKFKEEIEMGLDLGLRGGLSAAEMARDLKQYLQHPDKLFRRVRDERGQLHLSKAAKAYNPGAGVYRSSYKNAMRLARTENNMAYHAADYERWQQLDFVVGIEVKLSNNHTVNGVPFTDICDDLKGKYPKTFKFTGWHPQCRCHAVTILKTPEELMQENEAIFEGKTPDTRSVNEVKDVPDNFKAWIAANKDRIASAEKRRTLPYFIKDNGTFDKATGKWSLNTKTQPEQAENTPYIMTEKSLSELRKSGFDVKSLEGGMSDAEFVEKFNTGYMAKFNIREFDKNLEDTLKEYDVNMEIQEKILKYNGYNESYRLEYNGLIDGELFKLVRIFKYDSKVEHNVFFLPKSAEGKGLSKKIFRDLYKQYKNVGVETIEVHANLDVGGYTWSKYGFTANEREYDGLLRWARRKIGENFDDDEYNDFKRWISAYEGKDIPIYEVAYGKAYGKDLLLGSDWGGYIKFSNEKTKKIFENYIAK